MPCWLGRETRRHLQGCLVLLLLLATASGCALWPGAKPPQPAPSDAAEAAAAAVQAPAAPADSAPPFPARRRGWLHWLFFWLPQRQPPPAAQPLNPVGRIFLVNTPANFVLIETPSARQLPVGMELHTLAQGRVLSTVKVSRQRNPPFVVADLVQGIPQVGDRVYPVVLADASSDLPNPPPLAAPSPQPSPPPRPAPARAVAEDFQVLEDAEVDRLPPIEALLP